MRPHEHDLAAIRADIGLPERHLVALAGLLTGPDDVIDGVGRGVWANVREDRIGACELDECDSDQTMFAVGAARQQVVAGDGR